MYTKLKLAAFCTASLASLAAAVSAQNLNVAWKKGVRATSEDKSVQVKFGGRYHNDWAWITGDDEVVNAVGPLEDGNETRRARLYISGTFLTDFFFKTQYDFEDGIADFKDVYLGAKTPVGRVQLGQFKEPISLEFLTSSNDITFMERSVRNTFSPDRNTGFLVTDTCSEENIQWAFGVFRDTDAFGDSQGDGEYNLTGRVTGTPVHDLGEDGLEMVHLGLGASYRSPNDNSVRVRDSREVHLMPRLADTGAIGSDGVLLVNLEAAWVTGPFSLQGEYTFSDVMTTAAGASDPSFTGGYVQAAYTVTGESRSYKRATGAFGTITPESNFGFDEGAGSGAVELALRYSMLDLTDAGVMGGELTNIALGTNWYLNPNMRVMANVVLGDVDDQPGVPGGSTESFQMRFQVNF